MLFSKVAAVALLVLILCPAATPAPSVKSGLGTEGISPDLLQKIWEQYRLRDQQPFREEGATIPQGMYFHVHYKNDTTKTLNAGLFLEQSTILLDGKRYSYHGPEPTWFYIPAATGRSFLMSPDDYFPRVKRSILADTLQRWRWASGVSPGEHTLSFQFGGRQYGPVHYYWGGTGQWSVPYPTPPTH